MSGWRNVLWKACGAVVLVLVGVLAVSPAVNPDSMRDRLSQVIRDTTGLRVAFEGSIKPRFFPRLGVEMRKVALLPPLENDGPPVATVERIDLGVRLLPLLGKRIELGLIEIEGLDVSLVRYADGRFNLPRPPVEDVRVEGKTVLVTTKDNTVHTIDTASQGVRLGRSSLRYEDKASGLVATLGDIALGTGPLGGDAPFDARLHFAYAVNRPDISGQVDLSGKITTMFQALRFEAQGVSARVDARGPGLAVDDAQADLAGDLFVDAQTGQARARGLRLNVRAAGKALPAQAVAASLGLDADVDLNGRRVEARSLTLDLDGVRLAGELDAWMNDSGPGVKGRLAGGEFDPRALCRTLGLALPDRLPAGALTRARLDLGFEATPERTRLEGKDLKLDDTTFSLTAERRFAPRPSAEVSLKADALDLNRYMPASGHADPASKGKTPPEKAAPLMNLPMPVSVSLEVGALRAGKTRLSEVSAKARAEGGRLTVDTFRAKLYEGRASGTLAADLGRPVPFWNVRADVQSIALEPLLADLMGKSALSGRLSATAALTAEGTDGGRMLQTLNGNASIAIAHGAINGLSLPVATAAGPGGLQSAPFERAWANVRFINGVAASTDVNVVAPPNRLLVHGWVNLPARTLSLAAIATLGGRARVPIQASGSLDDPKVSVDAQALARGLLEGVANAPGTVLNAPGDLGREALDAVGNFLGLTKKK